MRISRTAHELWLRGGARLLFARGALSVRRRLRPVLEKLKPRNLILSVKTAVDSRAVVAWWYQGSDTAANFGDDLNPILIESFSGRKPVQSRKIFNFANKPVYVVVGSILQQAKARKTVVWGAGFIQASGRLPQNPQMVLAVRGPLSRDILLKGGVRCPPVYGDPALLCPMIYQPPASKIHKLGIVPHYLDKRDPLVHRLLQDARVKFIDIEGGIQNVIDDINSCEFIASSSLHGIIVSDAYGIPSLWIKFSDRVKGDGFKFRDYLAGVGRQAAAPMEVTDKTTVDEVLSRFSEYRIRPDLANGLLRVCPFSKAQARLKTVSPDSPSMAKRPNLMDV